ncbi:GNAT family N-acetyltransferase [Mangrovicella endophytica]|uniref:GNAT family N-acetyltransferase n=1 Tax=Mangrovicella endophytica TaxID=2066697 RepID=UPI000C9E9F78|nr:GNAT family N-acetyltransferase [Mangrovicella endophytica]
MGATETEADELGPDEVSRGVELSSEAHWNQTPEDWRHFTANGYVACERDADGRAVATGGLMTYGSVAWIGLVLVTPAMRRRGLATRLMRRCMDRARLHGALAGLDATPDGAKVYEQLGFRAVDRLTRFRRKAPPAGLHADAEPGDQAFERLCRLDAEAFGAERFALLSDFIARQGTRLYHSDDAAALVRPGRTARHLGPFCAHDENAAGALLATILKQEHGPLLVDLFDRHSGLTGAFEAAGFVAERPFIRMTLGGALLPGRAQTAFAAAGPEYG